MVATWHGSWFLVLSSTAKFFYKCTDYYDPLHEGCILWNDPSININWPNNNVILSDKDMNGIHLKDL